MSWWIPKPLLSVVIPAYQVEQYLPRCLDSILAEPATDLEVVVVDDHCADRTAALAHAYARRDPRVRVRQLTTHVGPGRARNAGITHARGDYLWFVDADDWLPAGSVPAVLARLVAHRPEVLVVDHAEVRADGTIGPPHAGGDLAGERPPGPLTERPQLLRLAHSACTKVVRRSFLHRIGLRFHSGWYEDSSYSHPLLLAAERIDTLNRVCYYYRQRSGAYDTGAITKSISDRHFDVFLQYQWMWADAQRTGSAYHRFRPQLFALMVNHLLVIAGNERRVPPQRRREFFDRLVCEYWRWLPEGGYPVPGGLAGLKHRLVRWDAYPTYVALRATRRVTRRAAGRVAGRLCGRPAPRPPYRLTPRPSRKLRRCGDG